MPSYIMADEYELPPTGLHAGVCVDYVDEGYKQTQFGEKHKVRYVFQIGETNAKGNRFTVSAWFNYSMHENASLRQFLEQWRGKPFDEKVLSTPPGFDLESVIGVPCALNIVHNSSGGKTYANIAGISAHSAKLGEPLTPEGYTRVEEREDRQQQPSSTSPDSGPDSDDDEIPF